MSKKKKNKAKAELVNSLPEALEALPQEKSNSLMELALGMRTQQNQISQGDTVEMNLRRYMLTNNRMLMAQMYVEIGIVQTLIDQPVDDAYAKMPDIKSNQLSTEQIEEVVQYIQEHKWFETFKQALKWGRLFGGAGVFINCNQNPESELRIDLIKKGAKVELYAVDRWELCYQPSGAASTSAIVVGEAASKTPYNLYGQKLHTSRVLQIKGKEAPSILKLQLMGWGMSEIERLIRSLNSFMKNQDVIFELLDEAKIDVFKIDGYNESLMQEGGTDKINKQITMTNYIKNYLNALVLDKNDDFEQKQMHFSGLPEMNKQNKENIASDLKMPINKLFGISSSGFSDGEDGIENYNSMLEGEIRAKSKGYWITICKLACAVVHGFIPEDIDLELPELRTLSAEQAEKVKDACFKRLCDAYDRGLIDEEQFQDACNKDGLLPIELDVSKAPGREGLMEFNQPDVEEKPNSKIIDWLFRK